MLWHQYLMGIIFILTGLNHFRVPKIYERIIPPYIPSHKNMVMLSGVAEVFLGILLLIPSMQSFAAWAIILMMLLFLPVHIFMLQDKRAGSGLPKWLLILRIPLQFAIIYWAWLYV